ncbi:MAG: RluA family pseudouridine synthase [Candidatus Peregrinibacteria bacterium]
MFSPHRILFQDDHLLAVNKLCGELVVAGGERLKSGHKADGITLPLLDFLRKDYPGLKPLHRLDFETSGVVVFAKHGSIAEKVIATKFAGWVKTYVALLSGVLPKPSGEISARLPSRGGEDIPAKTLYRVLQKFANSTLVEVTIEGGRHHQIRRHFAFLRHPLVLDELYGHKGYNRVFSQEFRYHRFFLHASVLEFPHPVTGEKMKIEAEMPRSFEDVLKKLRALSGK